MGIVPLDAKDAKKLEKIMEIENKQEKEQALHAAMKELAPKYGIDNQFVVNKRDGKVYVNK